MFPPGTIYAVYTEEDSVFCGGHFLTPRIMHRFLQVLGQLELNPGLSNEAKCVDSFHMLENFVQQTRYLSSRDISKVQLHRFLLALKRYLLMTPPTSSKDSDERGYLRRRKTFVAKAEREDWVGQLKDKVLKMSW